MSENIDNSGTKAAKTKPPKNAAKTCTDETQKSFMKGFIEGEGEASSHML